MIDDLRGGRRGPPPARPTPFRQFVLKVASRCNLSCDYCYMYEAADQGWLTLPRLMSADVVERTAEAIGAHARLHGLEQVSLLLHGGEPLLAGADRLAGIASAVRDRLPAGTRLHVGLQTNGVLLDERRLDRLVEADVHVAVSVDGRRADHDRHRRDASGRGSYRRVEDGLRLLGRERYRTHFAGLLCVVDVRTDPVATYEALLRFDPPTVDFLLPHGTWASPPPQHGAGPAPRYGRWLAAAFDRWYGAARRETRVRLFGEIIQLLLGGRSHSDQVGLSPAAMVIVNTNGDLEQVDTLRIAYADAASTALNVFEHSLDDALLHPAITDRQIGLAALCDTCVNCSLVPVCGGGHYAHRYRPDTGFRNPSVYCPDLAWLIRHISGRVQGDVDAIRRSKRDE